MTEQQLPQLTDLQRLTIAPLRHWIRDGCLGELPPVWKLW